MWGERGWVSGSLLVLFWGKMNGIVGCNRNGGVCAHNALSGRGTIDNCYCLFSAEFGAMERVCWECVGYVGGCG